ncbi:CBS domain-containing protein [Psychrobium sp. MM17-31]|jgi:CBS domain-containing protein|uniref:CBS domain-containing protein n=1 Tax=Psychrobium sp. MM17-31 TaxID=2917758 RepID=UPI001EF484D2|nr:CBS domain-containing protein [Psychrobium sp. MM17-31]MCG7533055.1 CBS domain-containing protein [Psychrobium sp. MM17-31]
MIDLKVKDFITQNAPVITSSTLLSDAVDQIEKSPQDSAVVVENERVVGILSERDCLRTLVSSSYYCDGAPTVSDIIKTNVVTIDAEDNIHDVASKVISDTAGFCDQTCFPVMQNNVYVGLIGVKGLVEALNQHFKSCQTH